jgi:hypothetical protein
MSFTAFLAFCATSFRMKSRSYSVYVGRQECVFTLCPPYISCRNPIPTVVGSPYTLSESVRERTTGNEVVIWAYELSWECVAVVKDGGVPSTTLIVKSPSSGVDPVSTIGPSMP